MQAQYPCTSHNPPATRSGVIAQGCPLKDDPTKRGNPESHLSTTKVTKSSHDTKTTIMADATPPAEPSKSAIKKAEKQAKMQAEKAAKLAKQATVAVVGAKKSDSSNLDGITASKKDNFAAWYQEVVLKAEMIEYYSEISGFFILRPASMFIWNVIRKWFQERIEAMDVEEASFPMFLSSKSLEKEKDHVEGFAPELAWVTKAYVTPSFAREGY